MRRAPARPFALLALFLGSLFLSPSAALATAGDFYAAGTAYQAATYSTHPNIFGGGPDWTVDINANAGDMGRAVYAPESGSVAVYSTGYGGGWGNSIIWTSADGRERIHVAHLNDIVKTGSVAGGDVVAHAGSTGNSTGDHMHVSRSYDGAAAPLILSGQQIVPAYWYNGNQYYSSGPVVGSLLSPYAGTTRAITPWVAAYSADCGNALDVGQGPSGPICFTMRPGHFVGGIVVSKSFEAPVDTFSFRYHQNWNDAWMVFEVWASDAAGNRRMVKQILRYGGYSEDVNLTGLNARKIDVLVWTRQVGDLGPGAVANWFCELSNIQLKTADWTYTYSNACGSGLDVTPKSGSPVQPIRFDMRPGHFVGGIVVSKSFETSVDTFSFRYHQNWNDAWMVFEVWASDAAGNRRMVKQILRYGGYAEDVNLTGLNARKIDVLIWTRQVGDLGSGAVANWFCELSNIGFVARTIEPQRLAGADRYATAIEVSKHAHPSGAPAVVLATGANFPDALCAAPLAKAYGGPVLLVPPTGLTSQITAELRRLNPSVVFVIGAVPSPVDAACRALPSAPLVTRLTGANRYATADQIAKALKAKVGSCSTVVVATGVNYPDAVSGAPLAAAKGWPILLVAESGLTQGTRATLAQLDPTSSLILGGEDAVPSSVAAAVPSPTRKAGANRYETCVGLADYARGQGISFSHLTLATGANFPDALCAGPLVAGKSGVVLLTQTNAVPSCIASCIAANKAAITSIDVIGGEGAVSESVVTTVRGLVQ